MNPTPVVPFPAGTILWVALGGALGSVLRYGVGEAARRVPVLASFPWGTLFVNVAGSLFLGWFLRSSVEADASPQLRAFVAIGICGGFTTFSTFAYEGAVLFEAGQPARAMSYALLSVSMSILATFAGFALSRP